MKLSTSMTTGELIEAINEFNQLAESLKNEEARSEMFVDIVRRSAQALGKPFEGRGSSWHDVPECIAALRARVGELERDLESGFMQGAYARLKNLQEAERERDGLLREQNDEVDEFNAGFDAYKSELDLDTAEQEYQNKLRLQGTPFHDVFSTGYAWAKFTTERAALAKGAK